MSLMPFPQNTIGAFLAPLHLQAMCKLMHQKFSDSYDWAKFSKPPTLKKEIFGKSQKGISLIDNKIKIDPKELEPNVFHLFSYKKEKYMVRKTDEQIVELYEVQE